MKTLIIDNHMDLDCWGAQDLCRLARLSTQSTLYVRRAPEQDLPDRPESFDRVIVSGSKTSVLEKAPWISKLIDFVRKTVNQKIPYLGVCYGHQILAAALGGQSCVRRSTQPEYGWTQIQILEPSPLLNGLPSPFFSFSAHQDEVWPLPQGMKLLANSEQCAVQAYQLNDHPIFGIQFHPEHTGDYAKKIFKKMKKQKDSPPLLNPNRTDELYRPEWGEIIFKNFLQNKD